MTKALLRLAAFVFALALGTCAWAQVPPGAYSSPQAGGGSAFGTPPATPNGVTFTACETPSGGVAGTLGYCWPGITVTSQTGTSYAPLSTDRSTCIEQSNASAITDTIPDVGGTNFQFGYNFCVLNLGATIITVNNTSASKFNLFGAFHTPLATPATTFSIFPGETAYFYSGSSSNWDVNVVGSGLDATGVQGFYGTATVTSTPPSGTGSNLGWKFCLYGVSFCTGIVGSTEYHLLLTQNWLSVGSANPANNSSGTGTDSSATTSISSFGGLDFKENSCSANFTPVASHSILCPDSTAHEILVNVNGDSMASHQGMMVRRMPVPIDSPGLVALVANGTTLCAASAGACNIAGQYHIHFNVWGSGTACGTPSPGGVTPNLSWTDENGVAHANVVIPMMSQTGAASTAVNVAAPTVAFQSSLANEGGSGDFNISTNGTVIQYGVAYAACGVGTGTYNIRISVTKLQSP